MATPKNEAVLETEGQGDAGEVAAQDQKDLPMPDRLIREMEQSALERNDLTPEKAVETRAQKKARLAQVLSRGVLTEKLRAIYNSSVPEGMKGKFVLDRPEDLIRYTNLGFGFDYKKGAQGLHGTGTDRIRVGDLVLMTISAEDHEILRELRRETLKRRLAEPKTEFATVASGEADRGGATPIDLGSQTIIDKR